MYPRYILKNLLIALQDTPCVILIGTRQVGKSTLLKQLLPIDSHYITFDDLNYLAAADADPVGFLENYKNKTLILDEIQRVPKLLLAIKAAIDRDRKPGQFILSGSANVLTLPKISESLAGRCEILHQYPLSSTEINNRTQNFVDTCFESPTSWQEGEIDKPTLANLLFRGGYPEVQTRSMGRIAPWFQAYLTTLIQRDIRDIAAISDVAGIQKILLLSARRACNLFNLSDIARLSGVKNTTVQRYFSLLEAIFLVQRLLPWNKTLDARIVKTPKLFFLDTGLLTYLLGKSQETIASAQDHTNGVLFENLVHCELKKHISWAQESTNLYFYRTHSGKEIDFLLERNQRKIAIEVKFSSTVTAHDFDNMKQLQKEDPHLFDKGIILYTGKAVIPFGTHFQAVPIVNLL